MVVRSQMQPGSIMIISADEYRAHHERIYGSGEIKWRDRDGNIWAISEMADEHLENAMSFLLVPERARRIHDAECYRMAIAGDDPIIGPSGVGAQDAFDAEFHQMMDMDPVDYIKTCYSPYLAMQAELTKREEQMEKKVKNSRSIAAWTRE